MSPIKLDFPEPDTPVITVKVPFGISTLMPFRLLARAFLIEMLFDDGVLCFLGAFGGRMERS